MKKQVKKILGTIVLFSMSAGAFESAEWNNVVRRSIDDRINSREVLGHIKFEPLFIKSVPKNPLAHFVATDVPNQRKQLLDVAVVGATHGRTEGIRRATLDAFSEVEAQSDKNAAKLAIGGKYQKIFSEIISDFEKMSDADLVAEAQKVNVNQGRADSYGFQDGAKAGQAAALKTAYVRGAASNGKAEAEKVADTKLQERAQKEANERAMQNAKNNIMKAETLKSAPAIEQNTDSEIKSRLFAEPDWEASPFYKPPTRQNGDKELKLYVDTYRKAFVDAARSAYAAVLPEAKTEAVRSLTYWFKNRYEKMDQTTILNELSLQTKVGFLSSYKNTREESYKKNYETAYNDFITQRENVAYPKMFESAYLKARDVAFAELTKNIPPDVEASVVDENEDGIYSPGEYAHLKLDFTNWGGDTKSDLVAKIKSAAGLVVMKQDEQIKTLGARTKTSVHRVLPFKIPTDTQIGVTKTLEMEFYFRGDLKKTIPVSVPISLPFEITDLKINKKSLPATIGLKDNLFLRAVVNSKKIKRGRNDVTLQAKIVSLDNDGENSAVGDVPKNVLAAGVDFPKVSIKDGRTFGVKKFRAEVYEDSRLAGYKDFEVTASDSLPRVNKGVYEVVQADGKVSPADLMLVTDNHEFAQSLKVEAAKVNLKLAVVNTNVIASGALGNHLDCRSGIPVVVSAGLNEINLVLKAGCPVLIAKSNQFSPGNNEIREIAIDGGYDRGFEIPPHTFTKNSFSESGLVFSAFDYFIGTDYGQKLGRVNSKTFVTSENEIKNWPSALQEFVMVTMPVEKKALTIVQAKNIGDQAKFDLLTQVLKVELIKEINDNKKWGLDEFSPERSLQNTRLHKFMKVYEQLPEADRKSFFEIGVAIREVAGSVFSGFFNKSRGHVIEAAQSLLSDTALGDISESCGWLQEAAPC